MRSAEPSQVLTVSTALPFQRTHGTSLRRWKVTVSVPSALVTDSQVVGHTGIGQVGHLVNGGQADEGLFDHLDRSRCLQPRQGPGSGYRRAANVVNMQDLGTLHRSGLQLATGAAVAGAAVAGAAVAGAAVAGACVTGAPQAEMAMLSTTRKLSTTKILRIFFFSSRNLYTIWKYIYS